MVEILGGELNLSELGIVTTKTYNGEYYKVWEVSDEDFITMCNTSDKDWKDEWGWWRSAKGSNAGEVTKRFNINHHYIKAWDSVGREEVMEEEDPEDRWFPNREYSDLLEYFCEEMGSSMEKNVCALAVDLAAQNNMTMAELFKKFQGEV